jgi:hypothetical protein
LSQPGTAGTPPQEANPAVDELRGRIEQLEALDESAFGGFGVLDWVACVIGSVVLPGLALWWFAG